MMLPCLDVILSLVRMKQTNVQSNLNVTTNLFVQITHTQTNARIAIQRITLIKHRVHTLTSLHPNTHAQVI